jgi:hypothetical protein
MRVDPLDVTSELSPAEPQRRQGLSRFLLSWWFVYLVASPIYAFDSGLPQPADVFMAVVLLTISTGYFVRIPVRHDLYLVAGAFLALVAVVNWAWWTQHPDPKFLLSSVFYVYDFAIVVAVLALARSFGPSLWTWTRAGLIATVAVEVVFVFLLPDHRVWRETGSFNNPNQLGYWTLLTAACLLSSKSSPASGAPDARINAVDLALLCMVAYIGLQTISRAAIGSFGVLFAAGLYFQGVRPRLKLAIALVAPVVALGMMMTTESMQELLFGERTHVAASRIGGFGERQADSLAERGYDRIWEHPEYLLYGAGEGAPERFTSYANEIHSTFATVLHSYGFLGFFLFLSLLWLIFRRAERRHLAYFVPICLYGLTHQGLRDTLLWVFLGIVLARTFYAEREGWDTAVGARAVVVPDPALTSAAPVKGGRRVLEDAPAILHGHDNPGRGSR